MPMNTTLETRPGPPGHLVACERARPATHLLDDLGGRHVALQSALPGGAERAGHPAAGLAGDAHRDPVGVAHQHRLDQCAVEQLPQRLAGGALVGLERAQRRHQLGQQSRDELGRAGRPAGRSSARGRRPAGRSSGWTAGGRGSPGSPSSSSRALRSAGVRSARWRGGLPRPRGSSKTRGRVLIGSLTTVPSSHPRRVRHTNRAPRAPIRMTSRTSVASGRMAPWPRSRPGCCTSTWTSSSRRSRSSDVRSWPGDRSSSADAATRPSGQSCPRRPTRRGSSGSGRGCRCKLAARRCPDAVLLPVDAPTYEAASAVVMDTLRRSPGR